MNTKPSVLFLSHGGGSLPLLGDEGHQEMFECLKKIAPALKKPGAILVVSAHWEEKTAAITSGANPSLIYDYYGFPAEAYEKERMQRLIQWAHAPYARFCHPREEHLLPLHVCYGMAQSACSDWFELRILNKKSSMYLWSPQC